MTERKPWPTWAANDYYALLVQIRQAKEIAEKALKIQHENVHQTGKLLSYLSHLGQGITSRVRELELRKKGDDQRWPHWASEALDTTKLSSRYITAGAKHGLTGIDDNNWKAVQKGINTCIDHIHKIETALIDGQQPLPDPISEALLRTLSMGDTKHTSTGAGWKRNKKR